MLSWYHEPSPHARCDLSWMHPLFNQVEIKICFKRPEYSRGKRVQHEDSTANKFQSRYDLKHKQHNKQITDISPDLSGLKFKII